MGSGLLIFISSSVYTSEHAGGDGRSLRDRVSPKGANQGTNHGGHSQKQPSALCGTL